MTPEQTLADAKLRLITLAATIAAGIAARRSVDPHEIARQAIAIARALIDEVSREKIK